MPAAHGGHGEAPEHHESLFLTRMPTAHGGHGEAPEHHESLSLTPFTPSPPSFLVSGSFPLSSP